MAKKGTLRGGKFSDTHSTLIPLAEKLVIEVKKIPDISKIVIGQIIPVKSGDSRLKLLPVQAGFRMTVRGGTAQQTLYIYCSDPKETESKIERIWTELVR